MAYQGDRVAQFSPLQQQSYQNAATMQTAPQLQDATAMAGLAGLGALNTSYTYNPYSSQSFGSQAQQYMSPYMQNVVDVQQQQAKRQADIQNQTLGAQAARSGAFGGGRDAIMRSQANAELQRNLQGIQATGLQNAYQQGMQQFNAEQQNRLAGAQLNAQQGQFGAGLSLQGLQTAMTGAQNLANIGQSQYQQNMGINALQNAYGLQQQQQAQNVLNTQYENYQNAQNYPYKQLSFMSDIVRGVPLTQTGSTIYQGPGSTIGQLTGLGVGALGLSQLAKVKDGGMVGYADGGSVESESNISAIVSRLTDQQLQQALQAANARHDVQEVQVIQEEMAMRASERGGMAGAFNQLPQAQQESMMAGGGIVAFSEGDLVGDPMGLGAAEIMATPKDKDARSIFDILTNEPAWKGELRREKELARAEAPIKQAENDKKLIEEAKKKMEAEATKAKPAPVRTQTARPAPRTEPATPDNSLEMQYEKYLQKNRDISEAYAKEQKADREEQKRQLEEHRKGVGAEALAAYGMQMAQLASRPGATFFGSAAGAGVAPLGIFQEAKKTENALLQNMANMKRDDARFNMAVSKNDMTSALGIANALRQEKKDQQTLEIERQKLGIMAQQASQSGSTAIQKVADDLMRANPNLNRETALTKASQLTGYSFRTDAAQQIELSKERQKIESEYKLLPYLDPNEPLYKRMAAEKQQKLAALGTPAGGGGNTVMRFDAQGKQIQ
jgi:hypothetical protein